MLAVFRSRNLGLLATAVVAVVVVVAFVLPSPVLPSQVSTSNAPSSTATSTSTGGTIATTTSSSSSKSTGSTSSRTFSSTNHITIPFGVGSNESLNFQPSSITVVVGVNNTIIWNDLDADQHTVTSMSVPAGATKFDSGILNQGQTFTLTLTVPGKYRFYCTIHPTWMRGTIVVKA